MAKVIVAVDDDMDLLQCLKIRLENEGYQVKTFSDSSQTEQALEENDPDLLIIDIFMPGKSGFEILEDFKERDIYQDLPKIILSGLDDDTEKIVAKGWGATEYITKPYEPEELVKKVKWLLRD